MLLDVLCHDSALNPATLGTLPTVVTEIALLRMQGNTSQLENTNLLITRKLKEAYIFQIPRVDSVLSNLFKIICVGTKCTVFLKICLQKNLCCFKGMTFHVPNLVVHIQFARLHL